MAGKIKQLLVYTKVTIICLILTAVVVVLVKNWQYKTNFWPGAHQEKVRTLWLILATGFTSIAVFWILLKMRRVLAELAQVRAERAKDRERVEHEALKQSLNQQERRIDEKIKKALDEEQAG